MHSCIKVIVRMLPLALSLGAAHAADAPLPQPLTLAQVLAMAAEDHPDLALADAARAAADADRASARSRYYPRAYIDLTPQSVQPTTENDVISDNRARLIVTQTLYDFGRSRALTTVADRSLEARMQNLVETRLQRRLDVMARFFDVLLADLRYAVDNETMASVYVNYDHARERHRLGQLSDIDLLALESRYQDALVQRTQSAAQQSYTRVRLADAINRPSDIPSDVATPKLVDLNRDVPEFAATYARARQKNPHLQALRAEVAAARSAVDAERARRRPLLTAEAEAAYYQREFLSRDAKRATLNLRIPLYQGDDRAAIARAEATLTDRTARLAKAEIELRETLWALLQELDGLKIERAAAKVRSNYRDLYLDRSRALYELEVRTELGDAMIKNTEAAWLSARADYRSALAWARLSALMGESFAVEQEEK